MTPLQGGEPERLARDTGEGKKDGTGIINNKEINWGKWLEYNVLTKRIRSNISRLLVFKSGLEHQ